MGFLLVACASLGLLCVCANLLDAVGRIVVASLKYVIRPVLLFMLVMFVIYCVKKGGI